MGDKQPNHQQGRAVPQIRGQLQHLFMHLVRQTLHRQSFDSRLELFFGTRIEKVIEPSEMTDKGHYPLLQYRLETAVTIDLSPFDIQSLRQADARFSEQFTLSCGELEER